MDIKRRIQLGALAVTVNSLLVLGFMTPTPAMASTCETIFVCDVCGVTGCQSLAPPGCTAVSGICYHNATFCFTSMGSMCEYQ
jgi:hypothetical protein